MVLLDPGVAGDGDGVGAEECFAASGGQAQADVGDIRQPDQGRIATRVTAEARRLLGRLRDRLVGVPRSGDARYLEEAAQYSEGIGLILLQLHESGPRQVRARTS